MFYGVMWCVTVPHEQGPFCSSGSQLQTSYCRGVGSVPVELIWNLLWTSGTGAGFLQALCVSHASCRSAVLRTLLWSEVATSGPVTQCHFTPTAAA
jgi:hypothetical protein